MPKQPKKVKAESKPGGPEELRGALARLYYGFVQNPDIPPSPFLGGFLRRHAEIRGSARGFLGAAGYWLLRHRLGTLRRVAQIRQADESLQGLLSLLAPEEETAWAILWWGAQEMGLAVEEGVEMTGKALQAAGLPVQNFDIPQAEFFLEGRHATVPVPQDIEGRWAKAFGGRQAAELALSFLATAPLDVRLHPAVKRVEVLEALRQAGADPQPLPLAPGGLRLGRKVSLQRLENLAEGSLEVQDEGSQLVALAVGDLPMGSRVLDACAGAGGKSLHVAALHPHCRVFAHDAEPERLAPLRARARSAAAKNITIAAADAPPPAGDFHAVLVDAPCLGFGRLRRDPATLWRGGGDIGARAARAAESQRDCLRQYGPLVAPGGVLVYAVCSFEPEETTEIAATMGDLVPELEPDPLPGHFQGDAFAPLRSQDGSAVTLLPSIHGTDGFFIARFRRRS